MSVIDYKYVETVTISDNDPDVSSSDYTEVCHLQLLVHDDRLEGKFINLEKMLTKSFTLFQMPIG